MPASSFTWAWAWSAALSKACSRYYDRFSSTSFGRRSRMVLFNVDMPKLPSLHQLLVRKFVEQQRSLQKALQSSGYIDSHALINAYIIWISSARAQTSTNCAELFT